MENICICLNTTKIEPNFWSLFYHDLFGSRRQLIKALATCTLALSSNYKKKTMKLTKFSDFDKVLRNDLWRPQGSLLFFLVSLFSCFDDFIAVFDYAVGRSMLSCNHGVHEQQRKAFADTNLLYARALNNFSTG